MSKMGSTVRGRDQSLLPLLLPAPPSSSPYLYRYCFYPSCIRKKDGNFPSLAAADFSGLHVQCASVFPPLISVLPTDNLAITSQGGSTELMLKLVGFFFFFYSLNFSGWWGREGGRRGKGSHKSWGWCCCSLSSQEPSDVPIALSLTFKLRVCFPVCFTGRVLSWPVKCRVPPPTPTPLQASCNCSHYSVLTLGCSREFKGNSWRWNYGGTRCNSQDVGVSLQMKALCRSSFSSYLKCAFSLLF